ncbi:MULTISPECIES: TerB family tellurite resistance protein [unclassified Agarivorans]|uniref:tellurite resistance TerB family protein n=1 Tax=unclassified Agarivorans TaxID=2636026 RepID=UPI0026E32E04|nr:MULTISPECIES: TerB family tellurite resistance protein [unclassified Agarivorans]MDO6684658.1 TerB family tellurite resistance protein [Agarivorans sp. 3_MG-2023]MDO6714823.1 TerB family tellurite resistance protein [Agarivorans sp. 2_MG-2023]MDO6762786.1 TerB family tellurite resistance protein [Agarivorans sp. 1_MG-2023]
MLKALKELLQATIDGSADENAPNVELAATILLVQLSQSDNQQSNSESAVIMRKIKRLFELTDKEAENLFIQAQTQATQAISVFDFTRHVKELDYQQRYLFTEALWKVAYADGVIDPQEEALIRQVSDLIYLSHSDYLKAKMSAQPS